jgi:acyl transferase domain-containing protein/acyl-CoA synthetase (AMP-forming)/AMP-acid ligase II/acyl carrier protein
MLDTENIIGSSPSEQRFTNLVELLQYHARTRPEHIALAFLPDGEVEVGRLSYAELDARARAFAGRLLAQGLAGHSVLLMLPSGVYYVVAFFGCLYAGAVPVPGYPPTNSKHAERMAHIVADCHAKGAIVSTDKGLESIRTRLEQFFPDGLECQLVSVTEPSEEAAADWRAPELAPESTAYLQYTSGSTSHPRGVIVSHGNLLDYCRSWQACAGVDGADVFVTWLPLFHDMGLILGVIQAIYVGATIVMMPPLAFLQKPLRWLAAIAKYRGTVSYAPNFAYELCAATLDQAAVDALDLSSWVVAGNAAEPVHADTLAKFAARFAHCGYRAAAMNPSYGLAEATLTVTSQPRLQAPRILEADPDALTQGRYQPAMPGRTGRTVVSCGRSWLDTRIVIADPVSCRPCGDGEVGEIWVGGPLVAKGYWQRVEKTQETFHARLDSGAGPFLRTGDLGFLLEGELYITGRIKDVIVIRGQNHYPQDIEHTAYRAHPALSVGHGAAFSVEVGNEERLVVVQELRRSQRNKVDLAELAQEIRSAVAELHGLQVYAVQLLKPASVHITSSGKIQRQACKRAFLNDEFEALYTWREDQADSVPVLRDVVAPVPQPAGPSYEAIAEWLTQRIAHMQNLNPAQVASDAPFTSLGLDSYKLVALSGELADWLARTVEPTLLYSYPSIDCLARHLAVQDHASAAMPAVETAPSEPIAVIGIACRFPRADSLDDYWVLLDEGVDAISEIPPERWDGEAYYQPGAPAPGKAYTKWGGFLSGVDRFDAQFFGISPREADGMDPQQRVLLQTTWHALEDAGIPPDSLAGSDTGVFMGVMTHDYELLEVAQQANLDAYFGTGTHSSIIANRISYLFDLHGPSWVAETACSSSFVALDGARKSLLERECGLAIVGGVNLLLSPELFVALSQAQMLSPSGRCMTFDARANGYVRSEGCAVLILKRYSDALRDNNRIHGLIASSALNQDGKSNGITAPSGQAQQAVIRRALAGAAIAPERVSYVEAHGTGTGLGDPIEMDALKQTYGVPSAIHPTLWVGSAKSNIGHTEPVSGLAGLIKVLLAMRHERIPQNVHFQQLNPHISLEGSRCAVAAEPQPWPRGEQPRLAAISSFGFGGANAHVIVQEAPAESAPAEHAGAQLLTLSAKTPAALRQLATLYAGHLDASKVEELFAICHTATAHRSHLPHRLAVYGSQPAELAAALRQYAQDSEPANLYSGHAAGGDPGKLAFLFTGQGSQYAGMGLSLYRHHALFRSVLEQCDAILRPLLDASLLEALYGVGQQGVSSFDLNQTMYAQPALFAVEYALAQVWLSCGARPDYLIGHSLGEYVAACVAGVFSLEDGLKLVAARGRLMQELTPPGIMIACRGPAELIARLAAELGGDVALAAYNTASDIVISGAEAATSGLAFKWSEQGVLTTPLHVTRAFHSPLMGAMLDQFALVARSIRYRPPTIPVISNVTGQVADVELTDPGYWVDHIMQPVAFLAGMRTLEQLGCRSFLEMGPHPVLTAFGRQTISDGLWLASLRRNADAEQQLLASLANWYVQGAAVDWTRWARGRLDAEAALPKPQALPPYPFQGERYWFKAGSAATPKGALLHPLLGQRIALSHSAEQRFGNVLSAATPWFVEQHKAFGVPVLPMAGVIEAALAAAQHTVAGKLPEWSVDSLTLHAAIAFEEPQALELQTVVRAEGRNRRVELYGRAQGGEGEWRRYASAAVQPSYTPVAPLNVPEVQRHASEQAVADFYQRCRAIGLDYGPGLQGLKALWLHDTVALARVEMPVQAQAEAGKYLLHPAMLDACFHVGIPFMERIVAGRPLALLPVALERLTVYRRLPELVWVRCSWLGEQTAGRYSADIDVFDQAGAPVLSVQGMQLALASQTAVSRAAMPAPELPYYRLQWLPFDYEARGAGTEDGAPWLVLCQGGLRASALQEQFQALGLAAIVMHDGEFDWSQQAAWEAQFAALQQRQPGFAGMLLALDAGSGADPAQAGYALSQSALFGLQQFLRRYAASNPSVLLCTRGALTPDMALAEGERMSKAGMAQGVLNGLAKSLALEFPYAKCVQLDLDPASADIPLTTVLACLQASSGSVQLALRGTQVWQARLAEQSLAELPQGPLPIRADATYLVTGGLRGVGLATAQWLAEQGARCLALSGRNVPDESRPVLQQLEAAGVTVVPVLADVADETALRQALSPLLASLPPLRGVIHSAGLTEDQLLTELNWDAFARVLAPKVRGAWNLHRLTAGNELDFFLLFSSVAALAGNAGQANYMAACAFLDSLAHYRRQRGLAACALDWGYWSETGLAARRELGQHMAHIGVQGIPTRQGLQALHRMLTAEPVQCGPAAIDWARFKQVMCPGLPYALLADLGTQAAPAENGPEQDDAAGNLAELLPVLEPEQARARIVDHLLRCTARVLRWSQEQRDELAPAFAGLELNRLGFDSLMAVEMRNRIRADLGVEVPLSHFLTGTLAGALAEQIYQQLAVSRLLLSDTVGAARADEETLLL